MGQVSGENNLLEEEVDSGTFDPAANLAHYWHPSRYLDSDDHAGSLDGIAVNMASLDSDGWGFGENNIRYIALASTLANGSAYSFSWWMKPNVAAIAGNSLGGWIFNDRENATNRDININIRASDSKVAASIWNTAETLFQTTASPTSLAWQMVTLTAGGGFLRLYKNGALVDSTAITGTPSAAATLAPRFGNLSYGLNAQAQYYGNLDNIRFYSAVLTAADIFSLYNLGRP